MWRARVLLLPPAGLDARDTHTHTHTHTRTQVTDIYEYGWGQSFHFSPKLPGEKKSTHTHTHTHTQQRTACWRQGRSTRRRVSHTEEPGLRAC
jgi:hypothetical protein